MTEIRIAVPADFQQVWDFYGRLIDSMEKAPYQPKWKRDVYPAEHFIRVSLRNRALYTAWRGGTLAGAMVVNQSCTPGYERIDWAVTAEPEEVSIIHALGVATAFQGMGVAKDMVQWAVQNARQTGKKAIRLDVLQGNVPAQKLYTAAGFVCRGTTGLYYEDTGLTEFLLYELAL